MNINIEFQEINGKEFLAITKIDHVLQFHPGLVNWVGKPKTQFIGTSDPLKMKSELLGTLQRLGLFPMNLGFSLDDVVVCNTVIIPEALTIIHFHTTPDGFLSEESTIGSYTTFKDRLDLLEHTATVLEDGSIYTLLNRKWTWFNNALLIRSKSFNFSTFITDDENKQLLEKLKVKSTQSQPITDGGVATLHVDTTTDPLKMKVSLINNNDLPLQKDLLQPTEKERQANQPDDLASFIDKLVDEFVVEIEHPLALEFRTHLKNQLKRISGARTDSGILQQPVEKKMPKVGLGNTPIEELKMGSDVVITPKPLVVGVSVVETLQPTSDAVELLETHPNEFGVFAINPLHLASLKIITPFKDKTPIELRLRKSVLLDSTPTDIQYTIMLNEVTYHGLVTLNHGKNGIFIIGHSFRMEGDDEDKNLPVLIHSLVVC